MASIPIITDVPACASVPSLVDNDEELITAPTAVRELCNVCSIKEQCFNLGMLIQAEYGIWGGYTALELRRKQLGSNFDGCIACGSDMIVEESREQICLNCGMSSPIM